MVLCTVMENVTVDTLIMRNSDKEIRGVVYGAGSACGYFGMLIFSIVGGILFDRVVHYTTFMFVGACDLTFAIFVTILSCCGVIKND